MMDEKKESLWSYIVVHVLARRSLEMKSFK